MAVGSPDSVIRHLTRRASLPAILPTDHSDFGVSLSASRSAPSLGSTSSSTVIEIEYFTFKDDIKAAQKSEDRSSSLRPNDEKASTSKLGNDVTEIGGSGETITLSSVSRRPEIDMDIADELISIARIREMLMQTAGEMGDDRWLDLDFDDEDESVDVQSPPSYDKGPEKKGDCEICFTECEANSRFCCQKLVCLDCMVEYLTVGIKEAKVHFVCPAADCLGSVSKDEILFHFHENQEILEKYRRFLAHANMEPNKKTCPRCSYITELEEKPKNKYGHTVICVECKFSWCFECQSPSHEGIKCRENQKGLSALRAWAKENSHGQRNARKCPKCKLLIQRTSGCDHMTCSQCKTDFCYKCGERHMSSRLFGHHYGRLSIFGCPQNFMNGRKKHLRRLVRGSIFTAKLTGATVGSAVIVGLLPVAVVAALFAGPVVGFVRLHRYRRAKRARKMYLAIRNSRKIIIDEDPFLRQLHRLEPRRDILPPVPHMYDSWDIIRKEDLENYDTRSVSNSSLNTLGEACSSVTVEVTACAEPEPPSVTVAHRSEVTHL